MFRNRVTKKLYLPFLLLTITVITYFNILPNKLFFDDEELIYKNAFVQNLKFFPKYFTTNMVAGAGKISNMYRPILTVSFALDYSIWDSNPAGFHLTSVVLHSLNTIFVFFLVFLLFKNKLLSFFTALLFSVHPINSEAVIYASGRTDPLFTFFTLLSSLLFIQYVFATQKKSVYYLLSLIFYLLSLLSKESAVIFPLLLLLIIWVLEQKKRLFKNSLLILPFWAISVVYIILRVTALNFQNTLNFYASQNIYSSSIFVRIYTFANAFWQYMGLFFFPKDLISARDVPFITSPFSLGFLSFLGISISVFILGVLIRRKNKLLLFSFFWFFISLAPSSGIIPINNIAAEHYLYFPSIGFFLVVSYLICFLFSLARRDLARRLMILVIVLICSLLIIRTIVRTFDWRDPITFYTRSLLQSPWHIPMRQNLAMSYADGGDLERAIKEYQFVLSLSDTYPNTHHNLANAYKSQKKYKEAEEEYYKALQMDPAFSFSYFGLLDLYKQTGEKEKVDELSIKIQQLQRK